MIRRFLNFLVRLLAPAPKLRLLAQSSEDLEIVSALLQDAILVGPSIEYDAQQRSLAFHVRRFAREHRQNHRLNMRRQCLVQINDILDRPGDNAFTKLQKKYVQILAIQINEKDDVGGTLQFTFAGDESLVFEVDSIDMVMFDIGPVSSRKSSPDHFAQE